MSAVLSLQGLTVALPRGADRPEALRQVSLDLNAGEILCVVGESGSGKSMMASAIMRLLPGNVRIAGGSILFEGRDLTQVDEAAMRALRGARIAMVFQEPMTALNPLRSIGDQIAEMFRIHTSLSTSEIEARVLALLAEVRIPEPAQAARAFPHELSGGQRQRAMIAMALALDPLVLIADEPTTALDVTIQGQILAEVQKLCATTGTSMIWITHDLSVVAGLADDIAVMYAGRIVEKGVVGEVLDRPLHPYTHGLIGSVPSRNKRGEALRQIPGMTPSLLNLPPGCAFRSRCPRASEACLTEPLLAEILPGREARCVHPHLEAPEAA